MTLIAGLAGSNHPLAAAERTLPLCNAFVAVVDASDGAAGDRYALAARWCAAGPFVPFSWRDAIGIDALCGMGLEAARAIQDAIEAADGQVELAFQIERAVDERRLEITPQRAVSGRDYLRARRDLHDVSGGFVDRLRASAAQSDFSVSLVACGSNGATGLVRCACAQASATRTMLEAVAAAGPATRLRIMGPLPPFGAGAEMAARLGLTRTRSAA